LPCKKEDMESFDYVTVKYLKEQIEYTLYDDDFATEAIQTFKNSLEQALNFKMQIQSEYINKGIGYYYNIYTNKLRTTCDRSLVDPAKNFIVWSTPSYIGIETFIYNVRDKIYIEISPLYKWHDGYPEDELSISFASYRAVFCIITVTHISVVLNGFKSYFVALSCCIWNHIQ